MSSTISLLEPSARFSLRLRAGTAEELGKVVGFQLDLPINRCKADGDCLCARLGPDEWFLMGPATENARLARELEAALAERVFSLVDIGHRNVGIEVAGAHAREILNGGCPLDLNDGAFAPGTATRTLLGKAEIVLLRPGVERLYRVECWRSFAPYVLAFLEDFIHPTPTQ